MELRSKIDSDIVMDENQSIPLPADETNTWSVQEEHTATMYGAKMTSAS